MLSLRLTRDVLRMAPGVCAQMRMATMREQHLNHLTKRLVKALDDGDVSLAEQASDTIVQMEKGAAQPNAGHWSRVEQAADSPEAAEQRAHRKLLLYQAEQKEIRRIRRKHKALLAAAGPTNANQVFLQKSKEQDSTPEELKQKWKVCTHSALHVAIYTVTQNMTGAERKPFEDEADDNYARVAVIKESLKTPEEELGLFTQEYFPRLHEIELSNGETEEDAVVGASLAALSLFKTREVAQAWLESRDS